MRARIQGWWTKWKGLSRFDKLFAVFFVAPLVLLISIVGSVEVAAGVWIALIGYDLYNARREPLGQVTCPMVDRRVHESTSPDGAWTEIVSRATFGCEERKISTGPCRPGKARPDDIEHCMDEKVAQALKRTDSLVCESEMVYSRTGYFAVDHKSVLIDTCRVK